MKRPVLALISIFLAALPAIPALAAYKTEYKLDIVPGLNTAWGEGAVYFANLVKKRSAGRINIQVYPDSQLATGKQTNSFRLLRNGTADFAVQSTINYSPQVVELNLFSLPFFISDEPDRYKALDAITSGKAGKKIAEILESRGVKFICFGENGFRELTNARKDIRTPADLAGMKIRVVGSPLFIDTFKALGANPIAVPWSETMTAIRDGMIDGEENPILTFFPLKVTDYHKHLTNWHYVADPTIFAANREVWESFSPADQELIAKAAGEAAAFQIALGRAGLDENDGGRNIALLKALGTEPYSMDWKGTLAGEGVTVTELTYEEIGLFVRATKPVVEAWTGKIGTELIGLAREDMASARNNQ
ncbi:MAG: TRAP transporter substrate-binding protein DctP [Desulfovibrionaceae bacterium]|nr:TRAP transporter substrate-binding protein DctP [Desulfovibrionaceae bacterium]